MQTQRSFNPRMLVLPAVIGFMIFGWFTSRGTTQAENLEPGDCFIMADTAEIARLDTPDCSEPHDGQIMAEVTVEQDGGFPADTDPYWDSVFEACLTAVDAVITRGDELPADTYLDFFSPVAEGWNSGERTSLCILGSESGLEGSFLAG